jgi:glutaredoxin
MNTTPIAVQLVTVPGCAKCAQAKQAIADAVGRLQASYRFEVREVDLTEQPEIAAQHGIWSTPALVINGELAFVGSVDEQELRRQLAAAAEHAA